jgi:orotate phosphoribosyltransferase
MALAQKYGADRAFCFNRKEKKDHGEGGVLVGHRVHDGDRVLIVEDVVTAGTSVRESIPLLRSAADVSFAGVIVSVDRMERGTGDLPALAELERESGVKVAAIVSIDEITSFLYNRKIDGVVYIDIETRERIEKYRAVYGAEK